MPRASNFATAKLETAAKPNAVKISATLGSTTPSSAARPRSAPARSAVEESLTSGTYRTMGMTSRATSPEITKVVAVPTRCSIREPSGAPRPMAT